MADQTGTVGMAGLSGMAVLASPTGVLAPPTLITLHGGPLDGEFQIVEMVPTAIGSELIFNVPHFQTFDPNQEEEVVLSQGLQAVYALTGEGSVPTVEDNWNSSWNYEFTGEMYVPTPSPLPPPVQPVSLTLVRMSATTTLVPDKLAIITNPVVMMAAESAMDVEPVVTRVQAGVVAMSGQSVMSVTPDWTPKVYMNPRTSLTIVVAQS
jgi:hypothetical protein